jgi:hypothetical protein
MRGWESRQSISRTHGPGSASAITVAIAPAVDYDLAQELANVIGADCRAEYGSAPDNQPRRIRHRYERNVYPMCWRGLVR